ncbi:hypothetical protein CDAR_482441 [Caerostris darwini]|uniref:Uncharacterized protein n=1 Tax=Caerostris darwini TaxID=1538125 RepID=A0AAV4TIZ5_9ARAC|nr:hypothetical protein CDAR_482441 [Caerostris darwini]
MLSLGTSTLVSKTILASQKDAGSVVAFQEKPAAHNPLVDGEKNPIASEQKCGPSTPLRSRPSVGILIVLRPGIIIGLSRDEICHLKLFGRKAQGSECEMQTSFLLYFIYSQEVRASSFVMNSEKLFCFIIFHLRKTFGTSS